MSSESKQQDAVTPILQPPQTVEQENAVLAAQLVAANDRIGELTAALWSINQWCDAYPESVFVPPTPGQLKQAHAVLREHVGITIDQISAAMGRHILKGLKKECADALATLNAASS